VSIPEWYIRDLSDIYAQAQGLRRPSGLGIYIRQIPYGHGITMKYSTSIVPLDDTLLDVSGYALFSCDLFTQNITTSIIATMAMINTAAPTAAPTITPLRDPELPSLLTEDDNDYNKYMHMHTHKHTHLGLLIVVAKYI